MMADAEAYAKAKDASAKHPFALPATDLRLEAMLPAFAASVRC